MNFCEEWQFNLIITLTFMTVCINYAYFSLVKGDTRNFLALKLTPSHQNTLNLGLVSVQTDFANLPPPKKNLFPCPLMICVVQSTLVLTLEKYHCPYPLRRRVSNQDHIHKQFFPHLQNYTFQHIHIYNQDDTNGSHHWGRQF